MHPSIKIDVVKGLKMRGLQPRIASRLAKKIYKDTEIKNNIRIHNVDRFLTSSEWCDIIFPTFHSDEEVDNYLYTRFLNNYRHNSFMFNRAYIRIGQWFRRYNDRRHISVQVQQKTFL